MDLDLLTLKEVSRVGLKINTNKKYSQSEGSSEFLHVHSIEVVLVSVISTESGSELDITRSINLSRP